MTCQSVVRFSSICRPLVGWQWLTMPTIREFMLADVFPRVSGSSERPDRGHNRSFVTLKTHRPGLRYEICRVFWPDTSYLLHAQFVPEKRLRELMHDLFSVSLSTATIAAMGRRTARRFESFLARVTGIISKKAPVKHLDETGLRVAARIRWLHVLCTPLLTALRIGTGRGDVGKDLEGILIHDDYASYFTLEGVRHGACNAHHLRGLQALIDIDREQWARSMHRLLRRAHRATRFAREKDREVPASLVARISCAWDRILDDAIAFHEAQPPLKTGKRGRPSRRVGHNLALRLQKHKKGCLRFLSDPRVPFTNNEAERDLRMAKLRQKISGGFRSEDGASHFATLRAVINTARKQDWNVLQTLAHPDPIRLIPTLRL